MDTALQALFILNIIVGIAFTIHMVVGDLLEAGYVQRNVILALAFNCVMGLPLLIIETYKNLRNIKEG